MRQTNVVNGLIPQNLSQYTLLQKKENATVNVPSTSQVCSSKQIESHESKTPRLSFVFMFAFQNLPTKRTIATVIPKVANPSVHYQTANNGELPFRSLSFVYAIAYTA